MKKQILILTCCIALFGCNDAQPEIEQEKEITVIEEENREETIPVEPQKEEIVQQKKTNPLHQFVIGSWTGKLRDKNLTIVIESIQGDKLIGYNIAGKNKRPLEGKIMNDDRIGDGECGGEQLSFKVVLNEPGDDKWDGTFIIYFGDCPLYDDERERIVSHSYAAYGSWRAYSGNLEGEIYLTK